MLKLFKKIKEYPKKKAMVGYVRAFAFKMIICHLAVIAISGFIVLNIGFYVGVDSVLQELEACSTSGFSTFVDVLLGVLLPCIAVIWHSGKRVEDYE